MSGDLTPVELPPTDDLLRAGHRYLAHYQGVKSALHAHVRFLVLLIEAHNGKQAVGLLDLQAAIAQADPSLRAEFRRHANEMQRLPHMVASLVQAELRRMQQQAARQKPAMIETEATEARPETAND